MPFTLRQGRTKDSLGFCVCMESNPLKKFTSADEAVNLFITYLITGQRTIRGRRRSGRTHGRSLDLNGVLDGMR